MSAAMDAVPSCQKDLAMSLKFENEDFKRANLIWKNLDKFVSISEAQKKQILFGVSGVCKSGEMVALMVYKFTPR